MSAIASTHKAERRERWAWYLYDFGNSAYAAVVLLAIYAAYFKGSVVGGELGSKLWGYAVGIAMLVVLVASPILGTIADFAASKKRFLFFCTALSCVFTAMLFFVQRGDWFIGMLFFILAEIGYRSAQVFYNALLPDIAHPDEMGNVSGIGWAIGSAGGIVCLMIVLVPVILTEGNPALNNLVVRLAFVFTAIYFALSALPTFLWVRERSEPHRLPPGENYLALAFKRLGATFKKVRRFREFLKFMLAYIVYNDGILMVLDFGAILGAVLLGMNQQELIIFMIIVQVTSVIGAYLFGLVTHYYSGKRALLISLVLMIAPIIWLYFSNSKVEFYVIGAIAGLALTGVQSVSRTVVGLFSPPGRSAEFYGFFAVTGHTSSFIGPTLFGWLAFQATQWYRRAGELTGLAAEQAGHRVALFSIVAFLAVGLLLLLWVNEKKGRAAAEAPLE